MNVDTVTASGAKSNVAPASPSARKSGESGSASNTVAKAAAPEQPRQSAEAGRQVARQINEFLKRSSVNVEFAFDEPSNRFIVRVLDSETQQVIRQLPSKEVMDALSHSLDRVTGLLLKQTA
jgi:flagellar protein FlaG